LDLRSLIFAPCASGLFIILTGLGEHETVRRLALGATLIGCTALLAYVSSQGARAKQ